MSEVRRVNPSNISDTLKEAVADGLFQVVYRRTAGIGEYGKVVYMDKPSSVFHTDYLLPQPKNIEIGSVGDENISPIKIISQGMDIRIHSGVQGAVNLQAEASVYVRVIPDIDDIKNNPMTFRLDFEVDRRIRTKIYQKKIQLKEEKKTKFFNKEGRINNGMHEEWFSLLNEISREVYEEEGIRAQGHDTTVGSDENIENEEREDAEDGEFDPSRVFTVIPGDQALISDDVVQKQAPSEKWVRLDIELPALSIDISENQEAINKRLNDSSKLMNEAIQRHIDNWLEDSNSASGGKLWAFPKGLTVTPSQVRNWNDAIAKIRTEFHDLNISRCRELMAFPKFDLQWVIEIEQDWLEPEYKSLHIALENRTELPTTRRRETDESVFQVSINCELPAELHDPMPLSRVEPSYRYNRYLKYDAMGFNCGITSKRESSKVVLRTTWFPTFSLPKIIPQSHGVDTSFKSLSDPNYSMEKINALTDAFHVWLDKRLLDEESSRVDEERRQFQEDKKFWLHEIFMIQRGIDFLKDASEAEKGSRKHAPYQAWLHMNETMKDVAGDKYTGWRLFQVAFILANIPSILTRIDCYKEMYVEDIDDKVTLLYFATGGGKSEAFFGLLIFNLFIDRLRGKNFGVTSMIRYPLRLLTIQQAQRTAKVLAKAELVRRKHGLSGRPFEIGFWVGGGNTPNNHNEARKVIPEYTEEKRAESVLRYEDIKYNNANSDWNKLPVCPFCKAETGLRYFDAKKTYSKQGILGHVCFNEYCDWNKLNTEPEPLPFLIVDLDIYASAPSVLLGTIDKLALIGQDTSTISKVFGMFGFAKWYDNRTEQVISVDNIQDLQNGPEANGLSGVKPMYSNGIDLFHDPFPSLIIQDEGHLLAESLGTFAGVFETQLFEVFRRMGQHIDTATSKINDTGKASIRLPKIVVASATVSDPERHIENLYLKPVIQFPYPGPDLYHSFYAHPHEPEEKERADIADVELRSRRRRVYATLLTNGKPHTTVTVTILSNFHVTISEMMLWICSEKPEKQEYARKILIESLSEGLLKELYSTVLRDAELGELATLIDLHRVMLTYVTNKKGGDQILSAEIEQVRKSHEMAGVELNGFKHRLISGGVDAGGIQAVIEEVESRPDIGGEFNKLDDELRSVVATSAISHGVDVEELNSMCFAGLPSDIAEYIQASSRVGRTHVGVSLLIPVPQRKRDRYVTEIHDVYHRFLERMISPPAIDRWAAKALKRTIPSFIQTWLVAVKAASEFIESDTAGKYRVRSYGKTGDVKDEFALNPSGFRNNIREFILDGLGLSTEYAPAARDYYRDQVVGYRVKDIVEDMVRDEVGNIPLRIYFQDRHHQSPETLERPMLSLRDVDVPGLIMPALKSSRCKQLSDDEFKNLMRYLRHGAGRITETYEGG